MLARRRGSLLGIGIGRARIQADRARSVAGRIFKGMPHASRTRQLPFSRGCYIYDLVFLCGRKSRTASDIIRPSRSRDRRARRDGLGVGLGVHGVDVGPELAHLRRDLFAEARAVENAVMADLPLQVVQPLRLRDVDAQVLGSESLADPANVVLLALDR